MERILLFISLIAKNVCPPPNIYWSFIFYFGSNWPIYWLYNLFWVFTFLSSLCILAINPLSDVWLTVFSHSVSLLSLLVAAFACRIFWLHVILSVSSWDYFLYYCPLPQNVFAYFYILKHFIYFPLWVSKFRVLLLGLWFIVNWFLCRVRDMDWILFFYGDSSIQFLQLHFSPQCVFLTTLLESSEAITVGVYFVVLYYISLIYMSVFKHVGIYNLYNIHIYT